MNSKIKFISWHVFKAIVALCIFLSPLGVVSTLGPAETLRGYVVRMLIIGVGLLASFFAIRYIDNRGLLTKLETMLSIQTHKSSANQSQDKEL
jgi:hypothetical protein